MGSINFNNLKNVQQSQKNYTYTDIFLDLAQEPFEFQIGNRTITGTGRDMKIAYDLNAIRNSIKNLFNTIPGERLLLPDYGCDLRQYIFENVTDSTAKAIGRTIQRSIKQWEPRVKVINIDVAAYVSTAQYEITLVLEVPFLQPGETFNIAGLLNKQGFTVV